ncbi:MAG: cation transporter [Tissierellales bacterium]|nr:cation transporter [Tissierellales bacterium]
MTDWLLKKVLKDNPNYQDPIVRQRVGYLAGIVGVITNVLLSVIKIIIGLLISSISVLADGVNNLADSASSITTLIGFKISNSPADKEHPYGHGRVEYIAALIVSFMVILVGLQFTSSSIDRIRNPKPVDFEIISFSILILSILTKVWLSIFNKKLGDKINSTGLKATATDAFGDVLITSVVVLSILFSQVTTFPIDGVVGLVVSFFIIYQGIGLIKYTIGPLIGEAPSKEMVESIYEDLKKYDYITGAHDLLIHSYGEGKYMGTVDVEFPADIDVITIHNVIDKAERELGEKYNISLVIHMDPLEKETKERYELRRNVKDIIKKDDRVESMHDFRVLEDEDGKYIELHVVINGDKIDKEEIAEKIKEEIEESIETVSNGLRAKVIIDIDFNGTRG